MEVFAPKETSPGETRAALTPEAAKRLGALGLKVRVETGIGAAAEKRGTLALDALGAKPGGGCTVFNGPDLSGHGDNRIDLRGEHVGLSLGL